MILIVSCGQGHVQYSVFSAKPGAFGAELYPHPHRSTNPSIPLQLRHRLPIFEKSNVLVMCVLYKNSRGRLTYHRNRGPTGSGMHRKEPGDKGSHASRYQERRYSLVHLQKCLTFPFPLMTPHHLRRSVTLNFAIGLCADILVRRQDVRAHCDSMEICC